MGCQSYQSVNRETGSQYSEPDSQYNEQPIATSDLPRSPRPQCASHAYHAPSQNASVVRNARRRQHNLHPALPPAFIPSGIPEFCVCCNVLALCVCCMMPQRPSQGSDDHPVEGVIATKADIITKLHAALGDTVLPDYYEAALVEWIFMEQLALPDLDDRLLPLIAEFDESCRASAAMVLASSSPLNPRRFPSTCFVPTHAPCHAYVLERFGMLIQEYAPCLRSTS